MYLYVVAHLFDSRQYAHGYVCPSMSACTVTSCVKNDGTHLGVKWEKGKDREKN